MQSRVSAKVALLVCFHLCFVVFIVFSLLGTSKIQVGGCDKSYMYFEEILLGLCCISCLITLKWMFVVQFIELHDLCI